MTTHVSAGSPVWFRKVTEETVAVGVNQKTEWTVGVGVESKEEMDEGKTFADLNRHVD